ncbi:MAG: Rib/alpha-like domain-containing protein [Corynebacterium glucuronolyticum]|nr:hypothetical protein [Corynebacterium glucuronolyticum]MDD7586285.1 Rib/alpha-like domain-containing protein [Mycobacteriaceae bacterium]MDY5834135.1 Rib/alpha-like domain-containing protein [Corynebacterium glucuronolyticum]
MVIVSYPDGSKDTVPVTVTVSDSDAAAHNPGFSPASGEAGETVTVLQTGEKCLPGCTTFRIDSADVPTAFTATVDPSGAVTVTPNADVSNSTSVDILVTVT